MGTLKLIKKERRGLFRSDPCLGLFLSECDKIEGETGRVKMNVVVTTLIVKGSLKMTRGNVTGQIRDVIQGERAVLYP